jgi:hypothetical protein
VRIVLLIGAFPAAIILLARRAHAQSAGGVVPADIIGA